MEEIVRRVAVKAFPGRKIERITDRGLVIKHNFLIGFDDGTEYYVKFNVRNEWSNLNHECKVAEVFLRNGIPVPEVVFHDETCTVSPYPYIIQKQVDGRKTSETIRNEKNIESAFGAIGRYYSKIHSVKNSAAGIWAVGDHTNIRFPVSPCRYMFEAEISRGSGLQLLKSGKIGLKLYEKIYTAWEKNIGFLESAQPSMIHASPFYWNIYLSGENGLYEVSKITALGDVMWWDPMWDVSLILNPPFFKCETEWKMSFLEAYGNEIDEKRLALYFTMQGLSALNGVYMEPCNTEKTEWRGRILKELETAADYVLEGK